MSRGSTQFLVLLLLLAFAFGLATMLQPRAEAWNRGGESGSVINVLLGDSRRLFANQAFTEADVYFHSGYYPSIFDQTAAPKSSKHMTSVEGSAAEEEHERQMNFLGKPRDWIEGFGRHFMVTEHTHLQGGNEREILPWLQLSAELDPQRVDIYTVAAFWLRNRLGQVDQAERFLREGLRNNPHSYEILFELGRLYNENYQDHDRARHVWELALRRWQEQEPKAKEPDLIGLEEILVQLARAEEKAGHFDQAIKYLEMALKSSPNADILRQQIAELKQKLPGSTAKFSKIHSTN